MALDKSLTLGNGSLLPLPSVRCFERSSTLRSIVKPFQGFSIHVIRVPQPSSVLIRLICVICVIIFVPCNLCSPILICVNPFNLCNLCYNINLCSGNPHSVRHLCYWKNLVTWVSLKLPISFIILTALSTMGKAQSAPVPSPNRSDRLSNGRASRARSSRA